MSRGPKAMIPSPGLRAGSQVPEISWRGAGPFGGWAFTGAPQPSRSAGAGAAGCWAFCDAALRGDGFCVRAAGDNIRAINKTMAEAGRSLNMVFSGHNIRERGWLLNGGNCMRYEKAKSRSLGRLL